MTGRNRLTSAENRRLFPSNLRELAVLKNCAEITITLDRKTAEVLADDVEFAVKYRDEVSAGNFLPPILRGKL